jgi:uncharacterized protein
MPRVEEIAQSVATIVRFMVDRPDEVKIHVERARVGSSATFRLSVDPTDLGKVIGKAGRTARSLRFIASAIGQTHKVHLLIDIDQPK